MKRLVWLSLVLIIVLVSSSFLYSQTRGVKKKRALPQEYGNVVINNFSEKNNMSPVVFSHWLHRAKFTCRLCHVDIGFGMKAGTTEIKAIDNMDGLYCGACHNGKMKIDGEVVFSSCSKSVPKEDTKMCDRCHSYGKNVKMKYSFSEFVAKFPKERFGNGIDWEKAEKDGLIKLIDHIEGISIKRKKMPLPKDFSLEPKVVGLPEITFSHQKHTVWNGCEVCHPEIFAGVRKGATRYSMVEIFDGKYCGVCHGTVAFPTIDCQRCHVKAVS